jgi:hypothetical protein
LEQGEVRRKTGKSAVIEEEDEETPSVDGQKWPAKAVAELEIKKCWGSDPVM